MLASHLKIYPSTSGARDARARCAPGPTQCILHAGTRVPSMPAREDAMADESADGFAGLGLSPASLAAVAEKGFEEPTPIQKVVIPLLLQGEADLIGQAQTGTGKTAAFGLPIIDRLEAGRGRPGALVLTPTRELAVQVAEELRSLLGGRKLHIEAVYGGQAFGPQARGLRAGADIVVGTPGRLIDHLERGSLDLSGLSWMVLDEADEMLDMGFIEDVERIMEAARPERRTLLFSATMPERIARLAAARMRGAVTARVAGESLATGLTEQIYLELREEDKFEALCRILDMEEAFYGLVFCRTKILTAEVARRLALRGYPAEALSGDVSQAQREEILARFRARRIAVLVATDVAARGIDVEGLSHVVNYSLPQDPEAYVHRIGRTGRAGREGAAVTFVTPAEYRKLLHISREVGASIRRERPPQVDSIIAARRRRAVASILASLQEEASSAEPPGAGEPESMMECRAMARELLEGREPEAVLAAALHLHYGKHLDRRRYAEIREPRARGPLRAEGAGHRALHSPGSSRVLPGPSRVFIRLGRKDGMDKRGVIELIREKAGVPPGRLGAVKVFELYCIVEAPLLEAERIIRSLAGLKGGKLARFDRGQPPPRPARPPRA